MNGPQRRFLLCLTALAALCVAAQAVTGISELALYMTPAFLIAALLLSGRYFGEDRIVARWRAAVVVAPRRRRTVRWLAEPVRALRSQHLEGSCAVRGPPAVLRAGRVTRRALGKPAFTAAMPL